LCYLLAAVAPQPVAKFGNGSATTAECCPLTFCAQSVSLSSDNDPMS